MHEMQLRHARHLQTALLSKQTIRKDTLGYSNTGVVNNGALGVTSIILIITSKGIPKSIRIKLPRHMSFA